MPHGAHRLLPWAKANVTREQPVPTQRCSTAVLCAGPAGWGAWRRALRVCTSGLQPGCRWGRGTTDLQRRDAQLLALGVGLDLNGALDGRLGAVRLGLSLCCG